MRFLRGDFAIVLGQLSANDVGADAILLDLGISSMQVDRPERGFSYATDAPLDMRMDPSSEPSAAELVNTWDERELAQIFRRYGEERFAGPIARAIVRRREEQPFARTGELVDTIKLAIPTPARFGEGHPAKRVFQALRIAVNDELGQLEAALPAAFAMLRPGGRLAVISFHSLEDRMVKRFFVGLAKGCTCPPDFPVCNCGKEPEARILTPKPREADPSRDQREPALGVGQAPRRGEALMSVAAEVAASRVAPRRRESRSRGSRGASPGSSFVGVCLAGIVAINVAVLRLNVELDQLSSVRADLKADIAIGKAQLSSASSHIRIETEAATRLGLVQADPRRPRTSASHRRSWLRPPSSA